MKGFRLACATWGDPVFNLKSRSLASQSSNISCDGAQHSEALNSNLITKKEVLKNVL